MLSLINFKSFPPCDGSAGGVSKELDVVSGCSVEAAAWVVFHRWTGAREYVVPGVRLIDGYRATRHDNRAVVLGSMIGGIFWTK